MPRMQYELFLRLAFGYALQHEVNRNGDPASLADTDMFAQNNLSKVKIGVGYAMEIYIDDIINNCHVDDNEDTRVNSYSDRILACPTVADVTALITEFEANVFNVYYTLNNGLINRNCP